MSPGLCHGDAEHDWRVQPNVRLPTVPPRVRLVCAECGAVSSGSLTARTASPDPDDVRTWTRFIG